MKEGRILKRVGKEGRKEGEGREKGESIRF
jgi:hypothetical protein